MRRLKWVLAALLLFLTVLLTATFYVAGDRAYYHDFQVNHHIDQATRRSQEELDEVSKNLSAYLKEGKDELLTPYYQEHEIAHMRDVHQLFRLGRLVRAVSLLLLIGIVVHAFVLGDIHGLKKSLPRTSFLWLVLFSAFALFCVFFWDTAFTGFHKLFFSNDLWRMDPAKDFMIQMLPAPFFIGMALRVFLLSLLGVGIFLFLLHGVISYRQQKGEYRDPRS